MKKTVDDLIEIIEQKIKPYTLNEGGRSRIAELFSKYKYKVLLDCISIG